ncbi:MAG: long-chain fatty acid--CoA ligase [Rhodothermales bacterium]
MAALVEFDTIPELFYGLVGYFRGSDRPALRFKNRDSGEWEGISWTELEELVHDMAGFLHRHGIRKGDRVAILSENRPEWAITDLATQVLGAVNVSLYTSLPPDQVQYILKDSGSEVFIVSTTLQQRKAEEVFDDCPDLRQIVCMSDVETESDHIVDWDRALRTGRVYWKEHREELEEMAEDVGADDLCALIYTSGTTGRPKGVMLTHRNFSSNAKSALDLVPFGPDDHHLSFLPLCHSFERTAGYTAVLACGARITYAESIDAVSKNLVEVGPTVMISVPRLFERIYNLIAKSVEEGSAVKRKIFDWAVSTGGKVAERRANGKGPGLLLGAQQAIAHRLVFSKLHEKLGGNLRFAVSGGAALPKKIGEFFEAAGVTIIEGYGLTETAPVLTVNPVDRPRYGTVGHVMPGITIGIQRLDDGRIIGQINGDHYPSSLTTDEGEIVVKGPNIMKGYWNDPELTGKAIDADGWYHTGDVGRFDDGYLIITDRIKHMIVSAGGKNVYPGPIEDEFKTVPWIDQIVVVGEGREFLAALVVPDYDALHTYSLERGLDVVDERTMLEEDVIQQVFEKEFKSYSRTAASHEKIRAFRLIEEPFSIENGLLTPTLKPRRSRIEAQYADLIEEMYEQFGKR